MPLETETSPEESPVGLVQLYTPAMLAELVGVKATVIRRWTKRGWLVANRTVRRLPYYDFSEVATARRLAEMDRAGASAADIERHLAALARAVPHAVRPLAELSLVIEGRHLLVRQGDGLVEAGGQLRFDFSAEEDPAADDAANSHAPLRVVSLPELRSQAAWHADPQELLLAADQLQEEGQLAAAADVLRAALAAGGPHPEICFLLAEVLYQLGELTAARERYYMAIELDENYVEARANLGCVLAETGDYELAVAAFQGALAYHQDYADVHYHLARTLDELGRTAEAEEHWRSFLTFSPDSPWADEARLRLE